MDKKIGTERENRLPEQKLGMRSGAEAIKGVTSLKEAKLAYRYAKKRLLNVNNWNGYAETNATQFYLYNKMNIQLKRTARVGDYIAIDIPGPGTKAGKGYDWVMIEKIEEIRDSENDMDILMMEVRPSPPPKSNQKDVAHFYTSAATSSFIITRTGNSIRAREEGRNEVANTKVDSRIDSFRNLVVANAAMHGFAFPQWKKLMQGLIK